MTNWISVEMANGKVETADRAKVRYASGTVASVSPPSSLRWDTPPQNAGQSVEVQYAWAFPSREVACFGAQWRREVDHSTGGKITYSRLVVEG